MSLERKNCVLANTTRGGEPSVTYSSILLFMFLGQILPQRHCVTKDDLEP